MSKPCPSQERWKDHLDGSLAADEEAVLTEHLDSCAACRKTLETLAGGSDSLLGVARQAGEATEASTPALQEVMAQFQAPTSETQAEPTGARDDSLALLTPSERPGFLGRLGPYEIQAVIGKGGFGIVLKAFDERLHRVVAIKVLSPAFAANGAARKRFIREARAAAAVKNEHVVGIHDVQEEGQSPYLVMEYIEGVSVQEKLDKAGVVGVKETLRIGMQIAEGLAAAHKQGLVHRDIKPANILLENGVERVKITDFGLARAVDDASVTQSGTVAGTPMYMSPEQAEGIAIDHRSDLFSLGTVLYAMCTGHPPFRASGTHAVLKRVIDASPRPIREINSEIPDWLCDIIAKLHAKKPEDRFQTAREVAELLGQHLAHLQQPAIAPRPMAVEGPKSAPAETAASTAAGAPRRRMSRSPILLAIAAIAMLSCLIAPVGLVLYVLLSETGAERHQAVDPRHADNLIVKLDDPAIRVSILPEEGGEHHFVGDDPREHRFNLKPGRYLVHALKNSVLVFQEWVTLEAGQAKTIHVTSDWVQLFNGKDLAGWKTHPTQPGDWQVESGALVGRGPKASHLFTERGDFRDFHLRLETKLNATGESSIFVRCPFGLPFAFGGTGLPGGFDVDFQGDGSSVITGQLAMFGSKPLLARVAIPSDTWFTIEVIAQGDRIRVKVNDQATADYLDTERKFTTGHLALQVYKAETVVRFRKIEIKELPAVVGPPVVAFEPRTLNLLAIIDAKQSTNVFHAKTKTTAAWSLGAGELTSPAVGQGIAEFPYIPPDEYDFRIEFTCFGGPPEVNQFLARRDRSFSCILGAQSTLFGLQMIGGLNVAENTTRVDRARMTLNERHACVVRVRNSQVSAELDGNEFVRWKTDYSDLGLDHPVVIHWTTARRNRALLAVGTNGTKTIFHKAEVVEVSGNGKFSRPDDPAILNGKWKIADDGWAPLFNGKDLTGWKTLSGQPANWKVEDRELVGRSLPDSYLFSEGGNYENFHLRAEVKLNKVANSGVFLRVPFEKFRANSPPGYEADLSFVGGSPGSPVGSLWTGAKRIKKAAESTAAVDQWFTLEINAVGPRLEVSVNGAVVAVYTDADPEHRKGHIALQAFEEGTVVRFRKIEIKELPTKTPQDIQK